MLSLGNSSGLLVSLGLCEGSSHLSGLLLSEILGHEFSTAVLGSKSGLLGLVVDSKDSSNVLSHNSHSDVLGLSVRVGVFHATKLEKLLLELSKLLQKFILGLFSQISGCYFHHFKKE